MRAKILRDTFDVALCHPFDATALMDGFDAVVVRKIGAVLQFQAAYDELRAAVLARGTRVFNQLTGRADMLGKQYLVDLSAAGQPVIPTVNSVELIDQLPAASSYIVKPMFGADSIGLQIVPPEALAALSLTEQLVQPLIDLRYEISFQFIDRDFQYALYAPDPSRRWDLERYDPGGLRHQDGSITDRTPGAQLTSGCSSDRASSAPDAGWGNIAGVMKAVSSSGTASAVTRIGSENQTEPSANPAKTATAKTSANRPDTDVTVARAGPVMASCSRASATMITSCMTP